MFFFVLLFLFLSSSPLASSSSLTTVKNRLNHIARKSIDRIKNDLMNELNASDYDELVHLLPRLLSSHGDAAASPHQEESQFSTLLIPKVLQPAIEGDTFAQCHQDLVIDHIYGGARNLFYIDLAAYEPVYLSNTYFLDRYRQWKGICIEANPLHWYSLSMNRTCQLVGAAVVSPQQSQTLQEFNMPNDRNYFNGLFGDGFDNNRSTLEDFGTNLVKIPSISFVEILKQAAAPKVIDYFSLDVEGAELLIMESFPFKEYRFNVMTVERPGEKLSQIFTANGYRFITRLATFDDELWMHEFFIDEKLNGVIPSVSDILTEEQMDACNYEKKGRFSFFSIFFILLASIFMLLIIFNRHRMNKM